MCCPPGFVTVCAYPSQVSLLPSERRYSCIALCIAISSIHLAVSEVHLEVIKHSEKVLLCMQTIECVSVHIPVLLSLAAKHIETLIEDILFNLTSTRHMLFYNQFVVIRANVQFFFVCFFKCTDKIDPGAVLHIFLLASVSH